MNERTCQDANGCSLASAVVSQQPSNVAAVDFEVQTIHRLSWHLESISAMTPQSTQLTGLTVFHAPDVGQDIIPEAMVEGHLLGGAICCCICFAQVSDRHGDALAALAAT
jgi:hypothetical protein